MDNKEKQQMTHVLLNEIKDYNNLLYQHIAALDARASSMMSINGVLIVLFINVIPNVIPIVKPVVLIFNLVLYLLSFLAYGVSFIFIRKLVAAPEPVHLVNNYYGESVEVIQFNLIESSVYVKKELSKVISQRAILMKSGGGLFILGLLVTFWLFITIVKGG